MATAEENFAREFNKTIAKLPKQPSILDMYNPLKEVEMPLGKSYIIDGIEDEVFSKLNGAQVQDLGKIVPELSVFDARGKRKTDVNGNVVKNKAKLPKGSLFIRADRKVDIPFKYADQETDYGYADAWVEAPDGLKYVYAVPKSTLFRVNMTALVVSSKHVKAYNGYTLKTWHYGQITIAVIPYNVSAKYTNTNILVIGTGIDYDSLIKEYISRLEKKGIVPKIEYFGIDSGLNNLVFGTIAPSYSEYSVRSELALSEEKAISYDQATDLLAEL